MMKCKCNKEMIMIMAGYSRKTDMLQQCYYCKKCYRVCVEHYDRIDWYDPESDKVSSEVKAE